jgi:L-seryl-tRNA(Ser) seleniumtransferase
MSTQDELRKLPGVDKLLNDKRIKDLLDTTPREVVTSLIKQAIDHYRKFALEGNEIPDPEAIVQDVHARIQQLTTKSLRPVINATGVIVHTNLGRSPFGEKLLDEVYEVLSGYNNLEFNLESAERGSRYSHVTDLLRYLTGAEDVLVVNNNAAAIMLVLRAFAKSQEVIVSRGELIEIGGSFRMPDIMSASDCKMIEVGTTNKTKVADYENAITDNTAMLLKVHQSNYIIQGFTTEATLEELVELGGRKNVPVVYDMGSGLLRKANIPFLRDEPDVRSTLETGIDLVTFSGDKLLGGPQAGIIAGKKEMIAKLKKYPLTRALRVGKETLSMLEAIALAYLDEEKLISLSPVFQMMVAKPEALHKKAETLQNLLADGGIKSSIIDSKGQAGGGSLPGKYIESHAVQINFDELPRNRQIEHAQHIYHHLLKPEKPVLGVLRKGKLLFDVLTIPQPAIPATAQQIIHSYREILKT